MALAIGRGAASVFRHGANLVVVESFADDDSDPLFLEYVASAPAAAKRIGSVEVPSGVLAITPSTDGCEDVSAKLAKAKSAPGGVRCGSERSSLLVSTPGARTFDVWLEKEVKRSWGSGRRMIVVPHTV